MLAKSLSERINNPVVVENRTGAGGNIGSAFVLKSPPNGYTLLNMSSTYPIQAAVSKLPFDPIDGHAADHHGVARSGGADRPPGLALANAKELAEAAKRTPGKLTYGSAGVGSIAHSAWRSSPTMGVQLVHVPYKGSSQAFTDVLGASVDMMLTSATFAAPHIKGGKVRALGIAGTQRMPHAARRADFRRAGLSRPTRSSTGRRWQGPRAFRPTWSPSSTGS